tara:strand:+ start:209 stop:583 length:375 start_codon:yes stop_codon:yes gene_type:complete
MAGSLTIYNARLGGFVSEDGKVKYKVNCGIEFPMFMWYAVNALEKDNPSEQLQWLYNSVMEDYIEKDKIHSTLDGKVLVDKKDLVDILESYEDLHHHSDFGSPLGVDSRPEYFHNLKGAVNNDT